MSKYFNKSFIERYEDEVHQEEKNFATPETEQNISNEDKEILARNNTNTPENEVEEDIYRINEKVQQVASESEQINKAFEQYEEKTREKIEQTFNKFNPAELFERLNQITVLMMNYNDRLVSIEEKLDTLFASSNDTESNNTEQFNEQNTESESMPSAAEVKKQLKAMENGEIPDIPGDENYTRSKNLEKVFPGMPNEAYEEGYKSLKETKSDPISNKPVSDSPKGGMSGLKF